MLQREQLAADGDIGTVGEEPAFFPQTVLAARNLSHAALTELQEFYGEDFHGNLNTRQQAFEEFIT